MRSNRLPRSTFSLLLLGILAAPGAFAKARCEIVVRAGSGDTIRFRTELPSTDHCAALARLHAQRLGDERRIVRYRWENGALVDVIPTGAVARRPRAEDSSTIDR